MRYPELNQASRERSMGIIYNDTPQKIPLEKLIHPINILLKENHFSLYVSHSIKHKNLLGFLASIPGHLQSLLNGVVNNPHQSIHDLPLLTPQEQQKILVDWNNTTTDYPRDKTVTQLFKRKLKKLRIILQWCLKKTNSLIDNLIKSQSISVLFTAARR